MNRTVAALLSLFLFQTMWLSAQWLYAQPSPSADEVFNAVQKKYADGASLRVKFVMKSEDVRGSLALKRGNKYILEVSGRTIICNGTTVWNYDAAQKKVVISDFRDNPDNISPERIFMNFPRGYKPSLSAEKSSNDLLLSLAPAKSRDQISDMQRVGMRLSRDLKLKQLAIYDGSTLHEWEISSIIPDAGLTDAMFEWKPPQGVQVIDLRD
ncbi:MAG: outer-membrane lipoprotein carrier protein LolA [Candidatus Kapabacteria bacterium]|jgi:outer membrane lipoprotein-sorting protein|nr:outer-membrane lipoprotein carrier protein LolA [Candidatus Kapabacteria bacterium]